MPSGPGAVFFAILTAHLMSFGLILHLSCDCSSGQMFGSLFCSCSSRNHRPRSSLSISFCSKVGAQCFVSSAAKSAFSVMMRSLSNFIAWICVVPPGLSLASLRITACRPLSIVSWSSGGVFACSVLRYSVMSCFASSIVFARIDLMRGPALLQSMVVSSCPRAFGNSGANRRMFHCLSW